MRKMILATAAIVGLTLGGAFLRAADEEKDKAKDDDKGAIHGVMVDNMCGAKHMDKDNPSAAALKMGIGCMKKDSCAASGYGVISDKKLYKFDDKGNEMAKKYLEDKDNKQKVVVKGTTEGDTIKVESIESDKKDADEKKEG